MRLQISIFICFIAIAACNDDQSKKAKTVVQNQVEEKQEINEDLIYYSWLDNLNVRSAPNLDAKVVGKINPEDALTKTGRTSSSQSVVVLRGLAYKDFWYEIETPEKQRAWVFGGAIKTKDEIKGNALISDLKFNFPSFGAYNLHNWKRIDEDVSGNDSVNHHVKRFAHPGEERKLVITETDWGETGYAIQHELLGVNDKPILTREVRFDNNTKTLTEEVITHNMYPKRKAIRTQDIGVSYLELNDRPILTRGEWKFEDVE